MKRLLIISMCFVFLIGCARFTFKRDISYGLEPSTLRASFDTRPVNLKELSKCAGTDLSVNIVNVENNNNETNIVRGSVVGWSINPRATTDQIVSYIENAYKLCRVYSSKTSPKTINISIEKIEGYPNGAFKFMSNAVLKVKISIPEKHYIETFTANQSTGDLYMAVAYSIHDISWQIINDPIIQDYITCR